ncbi:MAG: Mur ligase domain-containing protein, partial [Actinobacteria bacterium]|nr:Mur ligase domain-containing protein [Actinomycetota bacterium]
MSRQGPSSLGELAHAAGEGLVELRAGADTQVTGLAYDSRKVGPGDLFFCIPGRVTDGHSFASPAVASGAVALCVEWPVDLDIPQIVVTDVREAMPYVSAHFFDHPARDLTILGVTGTNGKTTTTYLLDSILKADGRTTGLIGTIETRIGEQIEAGVRTTPESLDLQSLFAHMRERGIDSVA